jgi:hypothetical protein
VSVDIIFPCVTSSNFQAFSSSFEKIFTSSYPVIVGGVVPVDCSQVAGWTWQIGLLINIASEHNDMGKLM